MKPPQLPGDGPQTTVGERLRLAYEAAVMAVARNWAVKGGGVPIPKEIERRKHCSAADDPIRTMMFLGSWNHT
ncbi:hypothetical protein PVL29_008609 [Vitis rotundifolia]|uniref:Uncharacterized protein n=1 Tax=Vitis rotundifolia TaxID=103349 RepID=A0AA38ZY89_VITRO|nr:hypothetical protein PVL29_008609 [Vitis rotundifolia]